MHTATNDSTKKPNKMFITAALTGAVHKWIDPLEIKFLSDDLIGTLTDFEQNDLIQAILKDGWQQVDCGGLWIKHASYIPKSKIELIGEEKTKVLLTIQLTAQGWINNQNGDLVCLHEYIDAYLTPGLVTQLEQTSECFYQYLLESNWQVKPSGYYYNFRIKTPYLPITADTIVQEALLCSKEGAAIVHLHTRELNGVKVIDKQSINLVKRINPQNNCIDVNQYEIIIDELLKYDSSLILNLSTSMRNTKDSNTINGDKSRRQH